MGRRIWRGRTMMTVMQATTQEIRQKYDQHARWYDLGMTLMGWLLGMNKLRRPLLQRARGKVLEVAIGTGRNIPFYPRDVEITGLELSNEMLERARRRTAKLDRRVTLIKAAGLNIVSGESYGWGVVHVIEACP